MNKTISKLFMQRALDLARQAEGFTSPNPMVGAVIVYNDRIIGEGFHAMAGKPHAEVNAFDSVLPIDRKYIKESTLYVTLEPCCHYGKTPPCSERIIREEVKKVVIAMEDPFPSVSGRGIAQLKENGIDVKVGLLKNEAKALNKVFITNVLKKRPYITLKWAESLDGFIDKKRETPLIPPMQFSSPLRLRETHKLRHLHDAILIGANTFLLDNPSLTNRYWWGRNPIRIVLDSHKSVFTEAPLSKYRLFTEGSAPIWIFSSPQNQVDFPKSIKNFLFPRNELSLQRLLDFLYQKGITSLLVEGGTQILNTFIDEGLWDTIEREVSHCFLKEGKKAPSIQRLYNS